MRARLCVPTEGAQSCAPAAAGLRALASAVRAIGAARACAALSASAAASREDGQPLDATPRPPRAACAPAMEGGTARATFGTGDRSGSESKKERFGVEFGDTKSSSAPLTFCLLIDLHLNALKSLCGRVSVSPDLFQSLLISSNLSLSLGIILCLRLCLRASVCLAPSPLPFPCFLGWHLFPIARLLTLFCEVRTVRVSRTSPLQQQMWSERHRETCEQQFGQEWASTGEPASSNLRDLNGCELEIVRLGEALLDLGG
eukprot:6210572-Pleurochrysis_carterae.AAC.1